MSERSVPRPALFIAAVAAAALALPAASAGAADPTHCVLIPACQGANHDTLTAALGAAASSPQPDVIAVAAGRHKGPFSYWGAGTNTVRITGAGVGATVLWMEPKQDRVLEVGTDTPATPNVVEDLTIELPGTAAAQYSRGLYGAGVDARRIDVQVPAGDRATGRARMGVYLTPGSLERSTVTMSSAGGAGTEVGVVARAGAVRVSDTTIVAGHGLDASPLGASSALRVERSALRGNPALSTATPDTVIDSTLLQPRLGNPVFYALQIGESGMPVNAVVRNLTIAGAAEAGATGIYLDGAPTAHVSLSLRSSLIRGVARAVMFDVDSTVDTSASSFDPAAADPGITGDPPLWPADPRWVDAAAGDFRLRADSPLIDRGTPGALPAGASATDLVGAARLVDGDGDGVARVDIGATEYAPPAPSGGETVVTPPPAGPAVSAPGAPPAPQQAPRASAPSVAVLRLTGLTVTTRRRVATARFTLSRAAKVSVLVQRVQRGRRVGKRCVVTKRRGAACTKLTTVARIARSFTAGANRTKLGSRKLAPGTYRVVVRADGVTARATFRVR